ncbi:hypothetical protein RSOL_501880 [Rhizoctonia solani AG-3 Rhs1AP]|uniref:Uncharacterized protein n=1 Tax=Rhizoctonia solani AG-3 Rhs1AP TaxID=1086054 RepID=X8JTX3_9AGAM|nr:hypothetical protein RSOL_501880 [Rhizoctonia solani AG-3 Rhs1AP]
MLAFRGLHAMSRLFLGPKFPTPGGAARGLRLKTQAAGKSHVLEAIRNLPNHLIATFEAPATGKFAEHSRSLHTIRSPSITQRLSLPARIAVNRPLAAPRLPKVVAPPRSITQVGLGTARNFSSRPVFQHLVENVPIALRSTAELDLDPRVRKSKGARIAGRPSATNKKTRTSRPKAVKPSIVVPEPASVLSNIEAEFAHYFPVAASSVVTVLTVPLQPSAARSPLPEPREDASPLDLASFVPTISSYQTHRLRVDTLFDRLTRADVWKRGASTAVYDTGSGVADVIQVRFDGWSAADVRDVLGHAGRGWCTIEERANLPVERDAAQVEDEWNTLRESIANSNTEGTEVTLVLPTLDFSASYHDHFDHESSSVASPEFTRPSTPFSEAMLSDNDPYFHSFIQPDRTIATDHEGSDLEFDSDFDAATWSSVSRRF